MENSTVTMKIEEFVKLVERASLITAIERLVTDNDYCDDEIRTILGVKKEK